MVHNIVCMAEKESQTNDGIEIDKNKGKKTTIHVYENEKKMMKYIQQRERHYDEMGNRTLVREALYALAEAHDIDMPLADYWCLHYEPDSEDTNN